MTMPDSIRVPISLVVAIIMYVVTSVPTGIWFASNLSARVSQIEIQTQNVPARIAVVETRMDEMVKVLRDIRDDLRKR